MKSIGVIGGMGPRATLDLFQKIINNSPAEKDQEHLPIIIDNLPQIPDRSAFILYRSENPLPYLIKSAERLVQIGASALCMPCNTAHFFVEELRKNNPVPFISIVECCLEEIKRDYPNAQKVGLLATKGTIAGDVYLRVINETNLDILSLPNEFEDEMMDIIYAFNAGKGNDKLSSFQARLKEMEFMGADVVIGGCTEISCLLPYVLSNLPVIDSNQALAKSLVRYMRGD